MSPPNAPFEGYSGMTAATSVRLGRLPEATIGWGASMLRARIILLAAAAASLIATSIIPAPPAHAATSTASAVLSQLRVANAVTTGYDRALFDHWTDADGDGCNARYEVLIEESVTPVTVGYPCTITGGSWYSYFDGATWTDPADVDIDHMVPLSEAWKSGAASWTPSQRQAFANDLGFTPSLVAVTDSVNQSKGDRDPALWMPPASAAHCQYATEWVLVKYRWQLAVDTAERAALTSLLSGTCGSATVTLPAVVGPAPMAAPTAVPAPAVGTAAPVYRFWSDTYRGHFYTISQTERDKIIQNYPTAVWKYEGAVYGAYTTQQPGTIPLYRFWSAAYSGHFYTTSAAERDKVIASYPAHIWQYESIAYYVFPKSTAISPSLTVARFWSDTYRHHFYTASSAEATKVKTTYAAHIWKYETDGFRVPTERPSAAPLPKPKPKPTPTPVPGPTRPANPGDARNCGDFATWAAANAWFMTYYPHYGDVAKLDGNNDGVPCESLPGAPR
jgi:hypothetical protein